MSGRSTARSATAVCQSRVSVGKLKKSDCDRYQKPMSAAKAAKSRCTVRTRPRSSVEAAIISAITPQPTMAGVQNIGDRHPRQGNRWPESVSGRLRSGGRSRLRADARSRRLARAEAIDDLRADDHVVSAALLPVERGDEEARDVEQREHGVAADDRDDELAKALDLGELNDVALEGAEPWVSRIRSPIRKGSQSPAKVRASARGSRGGRRRGPAPRCGGGTCPASARRTRGRR